MGEIARVVELLRQAYDGEPGKDDGWHGPSLRKLLAGVTAEQAACKPIPDGRSIWELLLHIAAWDEICARRLAGEDLRATTGSPEDWPAVGATTEHDWQAALARLREAQQTLLRTVAGSGGAPGRKDRGLALDSERAKAPKPFRFPAHARRGGSGSRRARSMACS